MKCEVRDDYMSQNFALYGKVNGLRIPSFVLLHTPLDSVKRVTAVACCAKITHYLYDQLESGKRVLECISKQFSELLISSIHCLIERLQGVSVSFRTRLYSCNTGSIASQRIDSCRVLAEYFSYSPTLLHSRILLVPLQLRDVPYSSCKLTPLSQPPTRRILRIVWCTTSNKALNDQDRGWTLRRVKRRDA
jgi:hypothetical protein